jgi:hypothetical protein
MVFLPVKLGGGPTPRIGMLRIEGGSFLVMLSFGYEVFWFCEDFSAVVVLACLVLEALLYILSGFLAVNSAL